MQLLKKDEKSILETVQMRVQNEEKSNDRKKEKAALKKRKRELDALIEKLYEDHVKELLSTERMRAMLQKYEEESKKIDLKLEHLEEAPDNKSKEDQMKKIKKLLKEYTEISSLTSELLYRLIERIEISQGTYVKTEEGKKKQQTEKFFSVLKGHRQ